MSNDNTTRCVPLRGFSLPLSSWTMTAGAETELTSMYNAPDAGHLADLPPQVVFQVLLANNLTSFTEFAFGVVRPGVVFKPNWHFEAVTEKLSQVARGDVRRLIITLPPRSLKSLSASVALPAWFLGRHPWERVVVVSYSDFLARTHANDFRRLVNHPIYQASFPGMRLERDTDPEIITTKRCKRIATSIDGTLTGLGGNLIIIDDPLKLGDAMSESVRERVIEWYRSTLLSRADDKTAARIVLVMQRVVLLRRREVFYVLEVLRGRFPFDTLMQKVMEVKRRYASGSTLLIEDSPISRGLIQNLRGKSINVTDYKPDSDKRARVIAQTDLFAGGSVCFPRRAAWLEELTAELLAFPGRHDDQVDALTQGLA